MPDPASDTSVLVFGELLAHLCRYGFLICVDEYLRLQAVLNRAAGLRKEDLKTLLCPLLASNTAQQRPPPDAFDPYFELSAAALGGQPLPAGGQPTAAPPNRRRYDRVTLVLLALTVLLIFALRPRDAGTQPS